MELHGAHGGPLWPQTERGERGWHPILHKGATRPQPGPRSNRPPLNCYVLMTLELRFKKTLVSI